MPSLFKSLIIGFSASVAILTPATGCASQTSVTTYFSRSYWHAAESKSRLRPYRGPATEVVVHPIDTWCCRAAHCGRTVKSWQAKDKDRGYNDIGFNFLVGGCEKIMEGVGWDFQSPYDDDNSAEKSRLHLGIDGSYSDEQINARAASFAKLFVKGAVEQGKVTSSYTVKCNFAKFTDCNI